MGGVSFLPSSIHSYECVMVMTLGCYILSGLISKLNLGAAIGEVGDRLAHLEGA